MNIRDMFLFLRRSMSPVEKQKADRIICAKVMALPEWQKAAAVCLYMSTPDEVDTKPLLAAALTAGIRVVLPRVEHGRLVLHCIQSIKDLTGGAYQILEPKKTTPIVDPKSVDLFIVPGVAFDRDKNRLGWGKGYYDKLLTGIAVLKIGMGYSVQLIAELPHTSYDVPMTMVVTEKELI